MFAYVRIVYFESVSYNRRKITFTLEADSIEIKSR